MSLISVQIRIPFFSNVSFQEKLLFTKHLCVLLKSGIPLGEALEIICDQSINSSFKKILQTIGDKVRNGQSLEKSLADYPEVFDGLYINLVAIGEKSGKLEDNLEYLAEHLKKSYGFKQKIIGASLYPTVVFLTAIVVGGGISFFVLPKLIDVFQSLDVKLPLTTQILLWIAYQFKNHGLLIFVSSLVVTNIFNLTIRTKLVKPYWQRFLLHLPIVGLFIQNVQMAQFTRNLGIMLKSGLPVDLALESITKATDNLVYKKYFVEVSKQIEAGKSWDKALESSKFSYFPRIASRMISVGEKTGKLDESLLYLADYFEDEVDTITKSFSTIFEPVMLLFIGLVVAFIALSIISPIYEFTGSIKR